MANKAILDVPIDDAAFNRFYEKFKKYREEAEKSPRAWQAVGKEIRGVSSATKAIVDAIAVQTAELGRFASQERRGATEASRVERHWLGISRNTFSAARHIRDATTSLLKWTALTGVFSGLLGAGGLFGIDRMAAGVARGRATSMGLGLSYGERASFGVNFSRLVDPGALLTSVAEARMDLTKRVGLYGAGLTERDLQGSTGTVAVKLLENLKRLADNTDPKMYAQLIQARQLGQFVTVEQLRRLRATNPAEFAQLVSGYRRDIASVQLSTQTQLAWQNFVTQMGRAGQQIETVFVRGLVPLEPGLERLSAGVEKTVKAFLGSETVKKWMDEIAVGLDAFARYIGTPKFEQDVRQFAAGLGAIVDAIGHAISWFGANTRFSAAGNPDWTRHEHRVDALRKARKEGKATVWSQFVDAMSGRAPSEREAYIRKEAKRIGLDPDIAVRVAKSEGLYGYTGDKGTSFGDYQLHYKSNVPGFRSSGLGDEFTRATGLSARDPSTWKAQDTFALEYAKKHGWAPWHGWKGSPWAGGAGQGGITVKVENNTGGNSIVTTNQLAGQQ